MRRLTLRKDVLTELTTTDLGAVVGGATIVCVTDSCLTPTGTVGIWCLTQDTQL